MAREEFRYKTELRVRFGETDLQGVVFNANYLLYADTAQMDYLRHIGVSYAEMQGQGNDVVIVDARVQFRGPARFDEVLEVFARVSGVRNSSLQMEFEMYEKESGRSVADAQTAYVITDASTGQPVRVPAYIRAAVRAFEGRDDIEAE